MIIQVRFTAPDLYHKLRERISKLDSQTTNWFELSAKYLTYHSSKEL